MPDNKVDGTDASQNMAAGFTDAQGDVIGAGNDVIYANGGDDTIDAGAGDDTYACDLKSLGYANFVAGDGYDRLILDWSITTSNVTLTTGTTENFYRTAMPVFGEVRQHFSNVEEIDLQTGSGDDQVYGMGGRDRFRTGGPAMSTSLALDSAAGRADLIVADDHIVTAFGRDFRGASRQLVGLARVVGGLAHRAAQLFHGGGGFFQRTGLLGRDILHRLKA